MTDLLTLEPQQDDRIPHPVRRSRRAVHALAVAPAVVTAAARRCRDRLELSPTSARGRHGLLLLALAVASLVLAAPDVRSAVSPAVRAPLAAVVLITAVTELQRLLLRWAQSRVPSSPGLRVASAGFAVVAVCAALASVPPALGRLSAVMPALVLALVLVSGVLAPRDRAPSPRDWLAPLAAALAVCAVVLVPVVAHSTVGLVTASAPHSALAFVGEPVTVRPGVVEVTVRHVPGPTTGGAPRATWRGRTHPPVRTSAERDDRRLVYRLPVPPDCLDAFVVLAPPSAAGRVDTDRADLARSTLRLTTWIGPVASRPCA